MRRGGRGESGRETHRFMHGWRECMAGISVGLEQRLHCLKVIGCCISRNQELHASCAELLTTFLQELVHLWGTHTTKA